MAVVVSCGEMPRRGMAPEALSSSGAGAVLARESSEARGSSTAQGAVLVCYALHMISGMVEFGLASLVAVALNYALRCVTQGALWAGHHTRMIRLFWLGLLGGLVIALSTGILGGMAILLNAVFGFYVLARLVQGAVRAVRGQAA